MNDKKIMILSEFWKIYEQENIKKALEFLETTKYYQEDEEDEKLNELISSLSLYKS